MGWRMRKIVFLVLAAGMYAETVFFGAIEVRAGSPWFYDTTVILPNFLWVVALGTLASYLLGIHAIADGPDDA